MRVLTLLVLILAALPYLAGFLAAPHRFVFLGSLNNVGDTGQYLAAIRQGMGGHLLYTNQFTDLHVAPILMYPLYTTTGLALAPFGLAPLAAYTLLHALAAMLLLAALWRFCRVMLPERAVLAYALALFGGGLYVPALLLSGVVKLPFAPVALTAPEFSLFATLLITPHGAIGLAAELWALGGYLSWRRTGSPRGLAALALGGVALGLCYPFGIPVLLAVVGAELIVAVATNKVRASRCLNENPVATDGHDGAPRRFVPPGTMANWAGGSCGNHQPSAAGFQPASAFAGRKKTIRRERRLLRGQGERPAGMAYAYACNDRDGRDARAPSRHLLMASLSQALRTILEPALALLPTLSIALYYFVLFRRDPLWGASNMLRLQPPSLPLLAAAFGPLLALAIPSMRRVLMQDRGASVAVAVRAHRAYGDTPLQPTTADLPCDDLALQHGTVAEALILQPATVGLSRDDRRGPAPQHLMRPETTPISDGTPRLVALWAIVNGLLLLAPLPQSERLLSGWSVPLALLAALTLAGKRPRTARRWVIALSLSNAMMALLYLVVALSGANRSYYAPAGEMGAVRWLAAHAHSGDVVMASAGSGNLIVAAAPCRVVVGQNFETFNWAAAQRDVLDYYAASTPPARRAAIVRGRRVTLVLAGPYERALGRFTPHGPAYRLAYRSDSVLIYRVVKT